MFDDQGGPQTIWEIDGNGCQSLLARTGGRNKGSELNTLLWFLTRPCDIILMHGKGFEFGFRVGKGLKREKGFKYKHRNCVV